MCYAKYLLRRLTPTDSTQETPVDLPDTQLVQHTLRLVDYFQSPESIRYQALNGLLVVTGIKLTRSMA